MAKKHLKIILSYQHLLISTKLFKSNKKSQKLDFNPFLANEKSLNFRKCLKTDDLASSHL